MKPLFWQSNLTHLSAVFLDIDNSLLLIYWLFKGHNWVHFAHRSQCTVTLNSNFAILKI